MKTLSARWSACASAAIVLVFSGLWSFSGTEFFGGWKRIRGKTPTFRGRIAELLRDFLCLLAGRINASAGVVLVFGGQREAQLAGGQVLAAPAIAKFLKDSKD
jgi:hypothetical protein